MPIKADRKRTVIDDNTQLRFTLSQFYQVIIILGSLTAVYFSLKSDLIDLKASIKGVYTKEEINEKIALHDKIHADINLEIVKIKAKLGMD